MAYCTLLMSAAVLHAGPFVFTPVISEMLFILFLKDEALIFFFFFSILTVTLSGFCLMISLYLFIIQRASVFTLWQEFQVGCLRICGCYRF